MRRLFINSLWLCCICIPSIFSLTTDETISPECIIIPGNILLKDNYGPPGYGENPESDAIETYYFLVLDQSIQIKMEGREISVREFQLVFPPGFIRTDYSPDETYIVSGELFPAHTGHHHSEILIQVREIIPPHEGGTIPLVLDFPGLREGEEFLINGTLVIFNGWPPNVRMMVGDEDYIAGIEEPDWLEEDIPLPLRELPEHMNIKGLFKVIYTREASLPCYEKSLPVFALIE